MKNKKGFTLVELLVVIAIIGILSTVAVINLNKARTKARFASAQSNLSSIMPAITDCLYAGEQLNSNGGHCAPPFTNVSAGVAICDGSSDVWPELPTDFGGMYCNVTSIDNIIFIYGAQYKPPTGPSITCTNSNGCVLPAVLP